MNPAPPVTPVKPKLTTKLANEVAVVISGLVALGEAVLQVVPAGTLVTILQVVLPLLGGAGIRQNVMPLSKVPTVLRKP